MTNINISGDLKSILERISGMCSKTESILSLCMDGFMKHKVALLDDAKRMSQAIHDEENELISLLSNKAARSGVNNESIKSLMAVVGHIEMATNGLDGILQHVKTKVGEGVLFSDKGVNEISHLFRETLDILKTAGDILLTRNEVLKKYVTDKYGSINQTIDAYSEEHEDRLIKGLCQPRSSSLYLSIVDALGKVVWHIKQAVERFFLMSR
ncbi:MAG: hypothetical protein DYG83_03840 [Candidatus Brocadia sp. AMX2]|uniref:PhoU domain-containing protein n=1 Tax=Candidatus Brocadia sinica JPN1 TaxID=1197129 RepID=A0ABQ0JZ16_9BACT|nr:MULTISPECIES: hypothetical protein [Brocadia]MBC6931204.1 hypothetical protein [Candidatus Brocadia sp.]MBL1168625.1 hypothetical protein [Candidatus Brocadia sp. AMX1]NOG40164.1 hypothetical protein [Planctomycetota bacterium]GIK14277.1 MAG: hypothetical protein BroJett002_29840 [Candidatus Brocadia sinica]KAA0246093.1 MAG: hypothetical protein EDM70_00455 [Candidatus Brocadia sp. AMX2]